MKSRIKVIIVIIMLVAGVSILLYPAVSNLLNEIYQTRAIAGYRETVASMDEKQILESLKDANTYNEKLLGFNNPVSEAPMSLTEYWEILNLDRRGILGYIEIEDVGILLPIYHGTSESAISVGCGHMEGTSLPVGGSGTHALLTSHRGLPKAKLFTDIDRIVKGDIFNITVMTETLYYKVESIITVLPEEVEKEILIRPGEDWITLMTCTPYGVNTHRLLVQGKRTEPPIADNEENIIAEKQWNDYILFFAAAVLTIIVFFKVFIKRRR